MTIILTLFLVLWVWGRFEMFALHIGHAIASKIDFITSDNYDVVWCPRISKNMETRFRRENLWSGLHNILGFCIAKPVQKPSWTEPREIIANMEF